MVINWLTHSLRAWVYILLNLPLREKWQWQPSKGWLIFILWEDAGAGQSNLYCIIGLICLNHPAGKVPRLVLGHCHLPGVTAVLSHSCASSIRSCLWLIIDALWPEAVYIGLAKMFVRIFHSTLWKNPKHEWTFWPAQYLPNLQVLDNCMESMPIQECMRFWNPASPHCRVWAGVPYKVTSPCLWAEVQRRNLFWTPTAIWVVWWTFYVYQYDFLWPSQQPCEVNDSSSLLQKWYLRIWNSK